MRILAALFAVLAVTVWWGPLPVYVQSVLLVFLALVCLALRRAIFLPKGAVESRPRDLTAAAPKGQDPEE
jgi:hypothetical protein